MSENQEVYQNEVSYKTVGEYLAALKEAGQTTAEVSVLEAIVSRPATSGQRRGQLAGVDLGEMTLEQLKREKINATSVLYKAKQRGAAQETIDKNQARVDAVNARIAELQPAPAPAAPAAEGSAEPAADHPVGDEL